MVTLTKREAILKIGEPYGLICEQHITQPDQTAVMSTCPDCIYIQDPCGCGEDEWCDECDPNHKVVIQHIFVNKVVCYTTPKNGSTDRIALPYPPAYDKNCRGCSFSLICKSLKEVYK